MPCSCSSSNCPCISCSCAKNVCPNPCSTRARIERRVRMPMTLFTSRQSAFNISGYGTNKRTGDPYATDPFAGPSDRQRRAINPLTGKRGVDKKHNSYARYLGRKKAPILRADMQYGAKVGGCSEAVCCCFCEQVIQTADTGNLDLQHVQGGDIVTQENNPGARGVVIQVIHNSGIAHDLDQIVIRVDDCEKHRFKDPQHPDISTTAPLYSHPLGGGSGGVPSFSIVSTIDCGQHAIKAPRRKLI